jgi:hypothetical protein
VKQNYVVMGDSVCGEERKTGHKRRTERFHAITVTEMPIGSRAVPLCQRFRNVRRISGKCGDLIFKSGVGPRRANRPIPFSDNTSPIEPTA